METPKSPGPVQLYTKIAEMFCRTGPHQIYLDEKDGKHSIVRRGLDWDGTVLKKMLVADTGRFFVKYLSKEPGSVVGVRPRLDNSCVNIHCPKIQVCSSCAEPL